MSNPTDETHAMLPMKQMVAKKRKAQDQALVLLSQGHTIEQTMRAIGRHPGTYWRWIATEPWFKDRANAVRYREEGEKTLPFVKFRKAYFDHDTPWHQEKIIEAIDCAEAGSITMILQPPGGGKTTTLEDYYNYILGEKPNHRFCVISEAQTLGRKILRRVANRMEDRTLCAAYIDRYGPFKPEDRSQNKPWNADVLTHVQAASGERDYSLEVKGAGSTIYGAQFDDIVLDDIQSLKNLNQTESLLEYFRQDVYTRMMRANSKGRIFIVGTRVGPGDFYEEILKLDIEINLVKIPALLENPDDGSVASYFPPRTTPNGVTIGFSLEDLEQIRRVVGAETWSRVYMQEPVSKHGRTFSETMIKRALDDKRTVSDRNPPGMYRMGSVDPALGGHTVWRVAGMDYDRLYLLDGEHRSGLARFEQIYEGIDRLSQLWRPNVWVIEGNAIQKGLLRDDRIEALKKKHGFRVESHQTNRNKMDEAIGVPSMDGAFLRGEISIPNGDEESRTCFRPMLEDLRRWRPDVPARLLQQDEVMALWFLYLYWMRARHNLASRIDTHIQRPGLPFRKMGYPVKAAM